MGALVVGLAQPGFVAFDPDSAAVFALSRKRLRDSSLRQVRWPALEVADALTRRSFVVVLRGLREGL